MPRLVILVLFFTSGAAALVYEVAWVRSLGLVVGASHLAVTTVLAAYMGGLALGGAIFGGRADRSARPLRLYGLLELGIAAMALVFLGLMQVYPRLYVPVARAVGDHPVLLTAARTLFAAAATLVPTTLMGGTLPVLSRFVARQPGGLARQLSALYAFNTFGAVAGTVIGGFFLLRWLGVTSTILVAAAASGLVGGAAILLDRLTTAPAPRPQPEERRPPAPEAPGLPARLALLGIGVSGFCALGYEVLWTRMLTLVVGTSAYSFALMLAAFLAGIGLGSHAFGLLPAAREPARAGRRSAVVFGTSQLAIGVSALAVTTFMRDLPFAATRLQALLLGEGHPEFGARLLASAALAFAYMVVPAFFMGLAFPAAAAAWTRGEADAGRAVGRLVVSNTLGAILGPIASGFVLIHVLGIERSLHVLIVLNLAMGLAVVASTGPRRWPLGVVAVSALLVLALRIALPGWGRVWDQKFFATFNNNARQFTDAELARDLLQDVEILYYREGVNETVSALRFFGSSQSFIVNGRTEASTSPLDVQLQRSLGHIPMLLHPDPRRVFVLGTGTGMTLGSISIHPEVERLVLGEIEEGMLGVARAFERWNHRVLDDPKLEVVLNDGRNFLSTTSEKFDVISADPIHPWSGGAGYLYTVEYFRTVASRLDRGGIASQWLPIYELTPRDLATVVRSFGAAFDHVLVWLTYYDAVLVGSNDPLVLDEAALSVRLREQAVQEDLAAVHMGSASDLLDHFLMGTEGARRFGATGVLNTDDNLWLEFSAPASQGNAALIGENVLALSAFRESPEAYLSAGASARDGDRWDRLLLVGRAFDQAHARFVLGRPSGEVAPILAWVERIEPGYGPLRFLAEEQLYRARSDPALVADVAIPVVGAWGASEPLHLSAVRQFVSRERVLLSVVDHARRVVYAQRYLDGEFGQLEAVTADQARRVLGELRGAAGRLAAEARDPAEFSAALRREAERTVGPPLPAGGTARR